MISYLFYLIKETFWITPWVSIPCIIIGFAAISFMLIMSIAIFLDLSSNKDVARSPYNIIFDRIIPLIACFSPTVIIMFLNPENTSWIERFSYIIVVHLILIIPLMEYWSKHRNWIRSSNESYIIWNQPILYKHLTIGIIYPALWGIYFYLIRYSRLNLYIYIVPSWATFNNDFFVLGLFLVPFSFFWIVFIVTYLNQLRYWCWYEFTNLIIMIHIYLLRFYFYFYLIEKLHRIAFLLGRFVSLGQDIYSVNKKYSRARYILLFFYMRPSYLMLTPFIIIFLEILLTKGFLHYSLYLIFWTPILYCITYFFYELYTMSWVEDVCKADYFAKNWENPKYPRNFWTLFTDNSSRYGFDWPFSEKEFKALESLAQPYLKKRYHCLHFGLPRRVQNYSYPFRLKAAYRSAYDIRWMHTEVEKPLHSLTSFLTRKFFERVSLIQNDWRKHYPMILRAEKKYSTTDIPHNCYINLNENIPQQMRFVLEQNLRTNFVPLVIQGVIVEPFRGQRLDSAQQPEPDIVIDMQKQHSFVDNRIHGLDQKSGKSMIGSSKIFSKMSDSVYAHKIKQLKRTLMYHNPTLNYEIITRILDQLITSSHDIAYRYTSACLGNKSTSFPEFVYPPDENSTSF